MILLQRCSTFSPKFRSVTHLFTIGWCFQVSNHFLESPQTYQKIKTSCLLCESECPYHCMSTYWKEENEKRPSMVVTSFTCYSKCKYNRKRADKCTLYNNSHNIHQLDKYQMIPEILNNDNIIQLQVKNSHAMITFLCQRERDHILFQLPNKRILILEYD